MRRWWMHLWIVGFCGLMVAPVLAQPVAVGAGAGFDDLVITVGGQRETVTVMRDARDPSRYCYVANRPRLVMSGPIGSQMPAFRLVKYQFKDPTDPGRLLEGGILQFSVTMALAPDAVHALTRELARRLGRSETEIRLLPLPIKSATVAVYALDGRLLGTGSQLPGIAPSFAEQELPFQLQIDRLDAAIYEALCRGAGGVPVLIGFDYQVLLPATGVRMTIDWDRVAKALASDQALRGDFGRWLGGDVSAVTVTRCRERLAGAVTVEAVSPAGGSGSGGEPSAAVDFEAVLQRLRQELVAEVRPPAQLDAAGHGARSPIVGEAGAGGAPGRPGSAQMAGFTLRPAAVVKKGAEVITLQHPAVVDRRSTCGALIGIGGFGDPIRDRLVTVVPPGQWSRLYYSLPAVADAAALGITQVDLRVKPVLPDKKQLPKVAAELATWRPEHRGWINRGQSVRQLTFALANVVAELERARIDLDACFYEVTLTITRGADQVLTFTGFERLVTGGVPVSTPMQLVEGVSIDAATGLTFVKPQSGKQGLAAVQITVTPRSPARTYHLTLNGSSANLRPVFLVEKEQSDRPNPVVTSIRFVKVGGEVIPWRHNGKNLREVEPGMQVILWDADLESAK